MDDLWNRLIRWLASNSPFLNLDRVAIIYLLIRYWFRIRRLERQLKEKSA